MIDKQDFKQSKTGVYGQFALRLFKAIPELQSIDKPNPHRSRDKAEKIDIFHPNHPQAVLIDRELKAFCARHKFDEAEFKQGMIYSFKKFADGNIVALSNRTYFDDNAKLGEGAFGRVIVAKLITEKGEKNIALKKINDDAIDNVECFMRAVQTIYDDPDIDLDDEQLDEIENILQAFQDNLEEQDDIALVGQSIEAAIDDIDSELMLDTNTLKELYKNMIEQESYQNTVVRESELNNTVAAMDVSSTTLKQGLEQNKFYIYMPLGGVELFNYLEPDAKAIPKDERNKQDKVDIERSEIARKDPLFKHILALEMLRKIRGMHYRDLIHADIKTENFLITEKDGAIMLMPIDFGTTLQIFPDQGDGYESHQGQYTITQYKIDPNGANESDNYYLQASLNGKNVNFGTDNRYNAIEVFNPALLNLKDDDYRFYQSSDIYSFSKIFSGFKVAGERDFSPYFPACLLEPSVVDKMAHADPTKRLTAHDLCQMVEKALKEEIRKEGSEQSPFYHQAQALCGVMRIKQRADTPHPQQGEQSRPSLSWQASKRKASSQADIVKSYRQGFSKKHLRKFKVTKGSSH